MLNGGEYRDVVHEYEVSAFGVHRFRIRVPGYLEKTYEYNMMPIQLNLVTVFMIIVACFLVYLGYLATRRRQNPGKRVLQILNRVEAIVGTHAELKVIKTEQGIVYVLDDGKHRYIADPFGIIGTHDIYVEDEEGEIEFEGLTLKPMED